MAMIASGSASGFWVVRAGGMSFRIARRPFWISWLLGITLLVLVPLAIAAGPGGLSPWRSVQALLGQGSDMALLLVRELRFPRVLAAIFVGAALGVSGALVQTVAHNRLATPAILGINEGAALAVMAFVFVSGDNTLGPWWGAPLGALAAALLLLILTGELGARGFRILLVGVALSAVLRSCVEFGLSLGSLQHATAVYVWSMGSLSGRGLDGILVPLVLIAVLLVIAVVFGRYLALLQFGMDSAASLGLSVTAAQRVALFLAVALSGIAVGVAGPVGGMVGLVALASPIVAQRLAGGGQVAVVGSALVGAVIVLTADTLGRVMVAPMEIPAGAISSIVGGPFVIWVLFFGYRE